MVTARTRGARDRTPDYDPYSLETLTDPYPTYARLRTSYPLYYNARLEFYALTRYLDIIECGRDWQTFSYAEGADIDDSGDAFGPGNFLEQDPPAHTAMRDVVRKAFVPKALRERLEAVIERESAELLDVLVERRDGDFASDVAWALPMRVVAQLLGFPRKDVPLLATWEAAFARRTLGARTVPQSAVEASRRFRSYFAGLIDAHERRSEDGLLNVIAQSGLSREAGASMAFLLWAAATETTASLLTNAAVLLDTHPDQREWLARRPEAIPDALEEILRFESPLQIMRRTTTRAVQIHGVGIPAGSSVFTVYGAANRDEQRFEDSETLTSGVRRGVISRLETACITAWVRRRAA